MKLSILKLCTEKTGMPLSLDRICNAVNSMLITEVILYLDFVKCKSNRKDCLNSYNMIEDLASKRFF